MLQKELGLSTWEDLLLYFPYRHIDRTRLYRTTEILPEMPYVQLRGQFISMETVGAGRKKRLVAHFTDGYGWVDCVWFNGASYLLKTLKLHHDYIIFGKPTPFNGRPNLTHPDVDEAQDMMLSRMAMQPHYSVTERMRKAGLSSRSIEHFTGTLMQRLQAPLPETLPDYLMQRLGLIGRDSALRWMHYPETARQLSDATYRMKFEELFFIQLSILRYSRDRQKRVHGLRCPKVGEMFHRFYRERLPFELTGAQKRVIREMHADMASGRQMNRLVQGDVGSGKTMVALMMMLLAVDNGYQACLMAPTEILAEQHLATLTQQLGDLPVRVELLTGTVKGKRRKAVLEGLESGDVHILIGTHAVIEDNVRFRNLGLVVIDEQHRFGVAQRARLWDKNEQVAPHVMVMTATPIPRTLAMTLYGDLDVSVIDELPPGRKPITTKHFYDERPELLYEGMNAEIRKGHQCYVVYPLVKESEKMDLKNVQEGYRHLQEVFPQYRLSMVHGQMKPAEKDAEMQKFVRGETQILVATTVIEVGVNVPNASVMVIQEAQRFGLSQLHQLRGRVGRGAEQSYCLLVTGYELSSDTRKRIQIMCDTTNGFEIAEADLKLRGPGDLEGTQQSGMAFDLHVANLARDGQIVQQARDMASWILDEDPLLERPENQVLVERMRQTRGDRIDWSNIS